MLFRVKQQNKNKSGFLFYDIIHVYVLITSIYLLLTLNFKKTQIGVIINLKKALKHN